MEQMQKLRMTVGAHRHTWLQPMASPTPCKPYCEMEWWETCTRRSLAQSQSGIFFQSELSLA